MTFNSSGTMGSWEIQKGGFLISEAGKLGMDVSGYGMVEVNPNSGYTYLWLEDYPFTLYMPISCRLDKRDIYALWSNPEIGNESTMELRFNTSLKDLESWARGLEDGSIEEDN